MQKEIKEVVITAISEENSCEKADFLAIEEPLEIRLEFVDNGQRKNSECFCNHAHAR